MTVRAESSGFDPAGSRIDQALRHRVTAGVGTALNRLRPGDSESTDIGALHVTELVQAYASIPNLLSPPLDTEAVKQQDVEEAINTIARLLSEHHPRLRAALYRPLAIIPPLEEEGEKEQARKGLTLNHQWFAWCWTSEAAWRALHLLRGETSSVLTGTEIEVLVPVAARQRFLALSEPYRGIHGRSEFTYADTAHNLFGDQSQNTLLAHTRHARWEWAELLDQHESLPVLEGAKPAEIEAETNLLLFEYPRGKQGPTFGSSPRNARPGTPLAINSKRQLGSNRVSQYSAEDIGFVSGIIERHLLPRYQVFTAARASFALAERPRWGYFSAAVTLVVALGALVCAFSSPLSPTLPVTGWPTLSFAAILAGAAYTVGLIGLIMHGRAWALPWLLRVPAAAAIGLFMVTTMHPSWWAAAFELAGSGLPGREPGPEPPLGPVNVAVLLAFAALAYLIANARNTGIGALRALLRAFMVWLAAASHALLIALLGLAWIIPVFSENGYLFRGQWTDYPQAALAALLQAGAWCLVAGVFSQMLWDDRTLTAPLTHARWRKEQR